MTYFARRAEWLALLEEELARRAARVELQAGEADRLREQVLDMLQAMAGRIASTVHLYPLDVSDMSVAEKLACRLFLPEPLQPAGLPTEEEIWSDYKSRCTAKPPGAA